MSPRHRPCVGGLGSPILNFCIMPDIDLLVILDTLEGILMIVFDAVYFKCRRLKEIHKFLPCTVHSPLCVSMSEENHIKL